MLRTNRKTKTEKLEDMFPKTEFPPEVELLTELNKANHERAERWLYEMKIKEYYFGKPY